MATKEFIVIEDDWNGEEVKEADVHDLRLVVNGISYKMDLGPESYRTIMDTLSPILESAQRIGKTIEPRRPGGQSLPRPRVDREQLKAVRDWAKGNGIVISDRGRLPGPVMEAFHRNTPALAAKFIPAPTLPVAVTGVKDKVTLDMGEGRKTRVVKKVAKKATSA